MEIVEFTLDFSLNVFLTLHCFRNLSEGFRRDKNKKLFQSSSFSQYVFKWRVSDELVNPSAHIVFEEKAAKRHTESKLKSA